MFTSLELRARLLERLAAVDEPERSRLADEVIEQYRLPDSKPSRWRVTIGVELVLLGQPPPSVAERAP